MPLTTDELQRLDSVHKMFSTAEQAYEMKQKDDAMSKEARRQWNEYSLLRTRASNAAKAEKRDRKGKIAQIRESSRIQIPALAFSQQVFATSYKENMGSTKRKVRSHIRGSRLRKKEQDARTVEESERLWNAALADRMKGLRGQPEGCSANDFKALGQFLTQDEGANQALLPGRMEEGNLNQDQINACISQYMNLDFGVDLRTDETVAKDSLRLEELTGKTQGLKHLIAEHPEMTAQLTKEDKQNLLAKLDLGEQIADYYTIQKKVMTDSWYRTHYNSEISYRYHEGDTLEQKNLTLLLWHAEWMKGKEEFGAENGWLEQYRDVVLEEEKDFETKARVSMNNTPKNVEFQKNDEKIEDSRHAEYFRQFNAPGNAVHDRLTSDYYVAGESKRMKEGLTRKLSNLPRLKAVQHMPKAQMEEMVENLAMTPVHISDPQEVEVCRQANLNGMRMFKEQLRKQMNYVKRKYGNGIMLMSPQEIEEHIDDFKNDFTNMQGMLMFIEYLEELPGMYDKNDPADQELKRLVDYYQTVTIAEGEARSRYNNPRDNFKTFSDYKHGMVRNAMVGDRTRSVMLQAASTDHLDVRWDTFFDENDVLFDEVIKSVERMPADKMQQVAGAEHFNWNFLAPETRHMPRSVAIRHFIEKEYSIAQEKQDYDGDLEGRVQTVEMLMTKINKLRTENRSQVRFLYDQIYTDMEKWLRETRGY